MNELVLYFIISLLTSSVVAALISGTIRKKSEREGRIFNAKFEAYKDFIHHLLTFYGKKTRLDGITLGEIFKKEIENPEKLLRISTRCMLVGSNEINKKIKSFNSLIVSGVEFGDNADMKRIFALSDKIHNLIDEIESLMRKDLGLNKNIKFW